MSNQQQEPAKGFPTKLVLFAIFVIGISISYLAFRQYLNLEYLASIEADLKTFKLENLLVTFLIAFAIYVAVTASSLPFATALSLSYAWFFGFWESLVLISFASTLGATLAFIFSRYFFKNAVERTFGNRFEKFNRSFEDEGPYFLFTLRLIPAVPFFVVNVIMALTSIKTRTFWWASQLGMLPGTAVYCFLGSQVDSLQTISENGVKLNPWLLVAFVLLGVFPLAIRSILKLVRRKPVRYKKPLAGNGPSLAEQDRKTRSASE